MPEGTQEVTGELMPVEIVRELGGFAGAAVLVRHQHMHFVVSSVDAAYSGPETLVFPATDDGRVTDWTECAGGRGVTREEAIAELDEMLRSRKAQSPALPATISEEADHAG